MWWLWLLFGVGVGVALYMRAHHRALHGGTPPRWTVPFHALLVRGTLRFLAECQLLSRIVRNRLRVARGPEGALVLYGDGEFSCWSHAARDLSSLSGGTPVLKLDAAWARAGDLLAHRDVLLRLRPSRVVLHCGGTDWDAAPARERPELHHTVSRALLRLMAQTRGVVPRVYYLVTPRRPGYSDGKWDFLRRVSALVRERMPPHCKPLDVSWQATPPACVRPDGVHLTSEGHLLKSVALSLVSKDGTL